MPDPALPGDLNTTIGRRIDLLADDTRRMLAAASVLGRRFDVAALAATTRLEPAVVTAALRDAVAAEVVIDEGGGRYVFAHALIEDALYSGLTPARRARMHRSAAAALEQLNPRQLPLAEIASHYLRALPSADRARAIEYARRAGADAAGRGATEQAVQHYRQALDAARAGEQPVLGPEALTTLLCELGAAHDAAGQPERSHEAYAEAIEIARSAGDATGLATAVLGMMGRADDSVGLNVAGADRVLVGLLDDARARLPGDATTLRAIATARLATARHDAGQVDLAQTLSAEAVGLAHASTDPFAITIALAARHTSLSCPEALDERLRLDDELRALDRPLPAQAHVWRVGDLLECGRIADADEEMETVTHGHAARVQPRARYYVALYRALRAQIDGSIDDAARYCEEARVVGEQVGARSAGLSYAVQSLFVARERRRLEGLAEVLDVLAREHPRQPGLVTTAAWVRVETGRFTEARHQLDQIGADNFGSIPRNGVWLANLWLLSEIAFALESGGHARSLYPMLLPYRDRFIVTSRVLNFLGSVEHSLGLLALTDGELDRAADHLGRARAAHARIAAPLLTARTDLASAALLGAQGDAAGARELRAKVRGLAEANGWFDLATDAA